MSIPYLFAINQSILSMVLGFAVPAPQTDTPSKRELNVENLAYELQRQEIDCWRVVLAQGIVEAGWRFESHVCRNSNNFCGMRIPGERASARSGEFNGYSAYATWQDCVRDIKLWQIQNWEGGTEDEYIDMVHRIWAGSPLYSSLLRSVMRKLEKRFPRTPEELAAA